jgi:hypothetical protein
MTGLGYRHEKPASDVLETMESVNIFEK